MYVQGCARESALAPRLAALTCCSTLDGALGGPPEIFFAVTIDGTRLDNEPNAVNSDSSTFAVDAEFTHAVDLSAGTIPLLIEQWDSDGALTFDDDQCDISSSGDSIELSLDLAACVVTGEFTFDCGTEITSNGFFTSQFLSMNRRVPRGSMLDVCTTPFGQHQGTEVDIVDTTPPVIACNSPLEISQHAKPVSFVATAQDVCDGAIAPVITGYECYRDHPGGHRKDKNHRLDKRCDVKVRKGKLTIRDSGGVGTVIEWIVEAADSSMNVATTTCQLKIVHHAHNDDDDHGHHDRDDDRRDRRGGR